MEGRFLCAEINNREIPVRVSVVIANELNVVVAKLCAISNVCGRQTNEFEFYLFSSRPRIGYLDLSGKAAKTMFIRVRVREFFCVLGILVADWQ